MNCLFCGKDHEAGTPHPLSGADMIFWQGRLNVEYATVIEPKVTINLEPKKKGRPCKTK